MPKKGSTQAQNAIQTDQKGKHAQVFRARMRAVERGQLAIDLAPAVMRGG